MLIQYPTDHLGDPSERDPPVQEGGHRHLVPCIEDGGRGPTRTSRRHTQRKGRERLVPHRLEGEWARGYRVEALDARIGQALRVGQRVQDGQFHRGKAELGQDAAVLELHEGVDDALRVYRHLDAIIRQAEEMVRLDDLERLVDECGTVHRDLGPHLPRRVIQRLVHRGPGQFVRRPLPERPAAGGQHQPGHRRPGPGNALQHRAVLGIHRHQFPTPGPRRLQHQLPAGHQRLLVGQCHALAGSQCGERGVQPRKTHDGVEDNVRVGSGGGFREAFRPTRPLGVLVAVGKPREGRAELLHLASEQCLVGTAGQGHHREAVGVAAQDIEGADTDGTGGPEHRHTRHQLVPKRRSIAAATGSTK